MIFFERIFLASGVVRGKKTLISFGPVDSNIGAMCLVIVFHQLCVN